MAFLDMHKCLPHKNSLMIKLGYKYVYRFFNIYTYTYDPPTEFHFILWLSACILEINKNLKFKEGVGIAVKSKETSIKLASGI